MHESGPIPAWELRLTRLTLYPYVRAAIGVNFSAQPNNEFVLESSRSIVCPEADCIGSLILTGNMTPEPVTVPEKRQWNVSFFNETNLEFATVKLLVGFRDGAPLYEDEVSGIQFGPAKPGDVFDLTYTVEPDIGDAMYTDENGVYTVERILCVEAATADGIILRSNSILLTQTVPPD